MPYNLLPNEEDINLASSRYLEKKKETYSEFWYLYPIQPKIGYLKFTLEDKTYPAMAIDGLGEIINFKGEHWTKHGWKKDNLSGPTWWRNRISVVEPTIEPADKYTEQFVRDWIIERDKAILKDTLGNLDWNKRHKNNTVTLPGEPEVEKFTPSAKEQLASLKEKGLCLENESVMELMFLGLSVFEVTLHRYSIPWDIYVAVRNENLTDLGGASLGLPLWDKTISNPDPVFMKYVQYYKSKYSSTEKGEVNANI